ncbi:MAG: uroporphyrinogen-III synthase [Actinobacteria bacterium]|nr:MAG: uroporphyrinogen-III synthase [Actinomycetota bacterium]
MRRMGAGPLTGRTVLVTRSAEQAEGLAGPLAELGAEVVVMPVIRQVDPPDWGPADDAIRHLAAYDWVVFGSTNAVERFFARCVFCDRSSEGLTGVRLAAVGSGTAARMAELGRPADLVPRDFRAEGLVDALAAAGAGAGTRVLVPRALEGRDTLRVGLAALGCEVDVVTVYRTVAAVPEPEAVDRLRDGRVDAVTFTSPSTARNFVEVLRAAGLDPDSVMSGVLKASVGPVTTEALRALGYCADVEAQPSTMEALAAEIAAALGSVEDA